jgi:hypothetical protein
MNIDNFIQIFIGVFAAMFVVGGVMLWLLGVVLMAGGV